MNKGLLLLTKEVLNGSAGRTGISTKFINLLKCLFPGNSHLRSYCNYASLPCRPQNPFIQ